MRDLETSNCFSRTYTDIYKFYRMNRNYEIAIILSSTPRRYETDGQSMSPSAANRAFNVRPLSEHIFFHFFFVYCGKKSYIFFSENCILKYRFFYSI